MYNSNKKKVVTICCPQCGTEYLPAEIYLPNEFLGRPSDIEKTYTGKIDVFDGTSMNPVEEYTCDKCGKKFRVVANINFKTYGIDEKVKFNNTYVSPIHHKKISLFEG